MRVKPVRQLDGYWAVRRVSLAQHPWADRVGGAVGTEDLRAALATMQRLIAVLEGEVT